MKKKPKLSSPVKTFKTLRESPHLSRTRMLVVVVAFAVIGSVFLIISHAATPFASIETESGTLTNGASVTADPTASGGQAVVFGGGGFVIGSSSPPSGTSVVADFRTKTQPLDTYSLGGTISTFSGGGSANINKSATWKANLQALGPLTWRIPLRYNGGNPGSSAGGAQTSGDASTYIQNIKAIGGLPVVVVGGDTSDNNFSNSDAAGLVHYFNDNGGQNGGPVHSWVIGNEYSNQGNDPIGYQAHLAGWASAMKSADPTITLSAPASPDMKYADDQIATSIANAAQYLDYLSYHAYQGASAGLGATSDYETYANLYQTKYITSQNFGSRVSKVHPALEEFNWAPWYSGNAEFYDWRNTVFIASVIGHSLSGGAHAYQYSDSGGPLGLMNDGSGQNGQVGGLYTKFPAYWGIAMWTGLNGNFRRFGDNLIKTTSSVANVEAYATDNGKIIAINKDTADHSVTIGLGGITSGSYSVWQTSKANPTSAPTKIVSAATYSGSVITIVLPAGTVSSIEL